jgi:hypothetical protein
MDITQCAREIRKMLCAEDLRRNPIDKRKNAREEGMENRAYDF